MVNLLLSIAKSKPMFIDLTVSHVNELQIVPGTEATVGFLPSISHEPLAAFTSCSK